MHVGGSQQQQWGEHLGCASSSGIILVVLYRESHGTDSSALLEKTLLCRNNFDFAIPLLQKPPLNGTLCKNKSFLE